MPATQVRRWVVAGGVVAGLCAACRQTQVTSAPGALPGRPLTDAAPRLNATTYFAHGHLLERQGNFERAIVQYRYALKLMPDFLSARNRLGITLNKLGRHSAASAEFRRALATNPEPAYLHNNLGFSLYLEGKYSAAESALRRSIERKPTFRRARMNYAVVLGKLGRYAEAFEELCLVGSDADAYYNLAMMQTEAGDYAEAARGLETALRFRPDFEAARLQLHEVGRLAAQQKTMQEAPLVTSAPATPDPRQTVQVQAQPTDELMTAAHVTPVPQSARRSTPGFAITIGLDWLATKLAHLPSKLDFTELLGQFADAAARRPLPGGPDPDSPFGVPEAADDLTTDLPVTAGEPGDFVITDEATGETGPLIPDAADPEFLQKIVAAIVEAMRAESETLEDLWCEFDRYMEAHAEQSETTTESPE